MRPLFRDPVIRPNAHKTSTGLLKDANLGKQFVKLA
jgi:hypothetical protein